jgi:phenylacetate-CoA ligase
VGGVRGRADDMLVIRGVNLFPSAVEQVVRSFPGLTPEYLIVIDASVLDAHGFLTGIRLRVERADATVSASAAQQLEQEIRARLQIRAQVELLEAGQLPRSTHKARRVVREGLPS